MLAGVAVLQRQHNDSGSNQLRDSNAVGHSLGMMSVMCVPMSELGTPASNTWQPNWLL